MHGRRGSQWFSHIRGVKEVEGIFYPAGKWLIL